MSKIMTFEEVEEFFDYIADLMALGSSNFIVDDTFLVDAVEIYEEDFHVYDTVVAQDYEDYADYYFGFDFKFERIKDDTIHITRPEDGMVWTVRRLTKEECGGE